MSGRNHLRGRAICGVVLFLILVIPSLGLEITTPSSINEGEPLEVSVAGDGLLVIRENGQIVHAGTTSITYQRTTTSQDSGITTFGFESDSPTETNETRQVQIINTPLDFEIIEPDSQDIEENPVTFTVKPNWQPEVCWVTVDGKSNTLQFSGNDLYSTSANVGDGVHDAVYKCKLLDELAEKTKTIVVDTNPPDVLRTEPSGEIEASHVPLLVETDEISLCRYGTSDVPYSEMPQSFGTTYAIINEKTVPILSPGASTYFVRCEDVHGNVMEQSAVISFTARLAPAATINLEGDRPLKAGTYKVKLTTNIPLSETPSLQYVLEETKSTRTVGLTGSNANWEGYLVVPENSPDSVITFNFIGESREGIEGSEIVSGKIVEIDTLAPNPVDAITATSGDGRITIKWVDLNDEDDVKYNIYRSVKEPVTYADYLAEVDGLDYTDTRVSGAEYYYYRVAPVDDAGNIGQLSEEVYGSGVQGSLEEALGIDAVALIRIDNTAEDVLAMMITLNETIDKLEKETNPIRIGAIEDIGLLDRARLERANLIQTLESLMSLKQSNPTESHVTEALSSATRAVGSAKKAVVIRLEVESQIEMNQATDLANLERNIPFALKDRNTGPAEKDTYFERSAILNERLTVSLVARGFRVWDGHGTPHEYTYVTKTVELDTPENNVRVIEVIPKEFAEDVSEIKFQKQPLVLEDDPVVQYTYPVLERASFSYFIEGIVPLEYVKSSRTLAYPDFIQTTPTVSENNDDMLTGRVVGDTSFVPSTEMILLVLGIFVVLALGGYYVSIGRDEPSPFNGLPQTVFVQQPRPVQRASVKRIIVPTREFDESLEEFNTPQDANTMLQKASDSINNKDYDTALYSYKKILELLEANPELQSEHSEMINLVYKKLMLYKKLNDAGAAIENSNKELLEKSLKDVKELAKEIGDDNTILINDAKEAYSKFARDLNSLALKAVEGY